MPKLSDIALPVFVLLFCTAFAELLVRHLDGFPLFAVSLPERPMQAHAAAMGRDDGRRYALGAKLADGVDPGWFDQDPPALAGRQPAPSLAALFSTLPAGGVRVDMFKLWNSEYFAKNACSSPIFLSFPHRAFLFDPVDGSQHPPYRFPYDVTTPAGLRTNQFGFRSAPISTDKPPRTIRIAFVGASTTVSQHGYPFSYPELVGYWLNLWAKRARLDVTFEIINAGREGINSTDIAAVVHTELLPFAPDFVVYYEGANQMSPAAIVPDHAGYHAAPGAAAAASPLLDALGRYSALARRATASTGALQANAGAEPKKPDYAVVWPEGVDEFDPPLDAPNLPANLSTTLKDLNAIRQDADSVGGEMVMSSFRWLVKDGMVLDPIRHSSILQYLNGVFYPFRYREMERIAAFQNRVFAKWASRQGVYFLDLAKELPFAPDLMEDAIHETYPGLRLRAWLVLQDLIPLVERRIDEGRLPKPAAVAGVAHPAFPGNPRTVAFNCTPASLMAGMPAVTSDNPQSAVESGEAGTVVIRTAPKSWYYAADAYAPAGILSPGGEFKLEVDARVTQGSAYVGVLSADDSRWLVSGELARGQDFAKVDLPFTSDTGGRAHVTFYSGEANAAAVVELRSLRLLSAGPTIRLLGPGLVAD